jgi:oxalate decarboxylase/phosphoglucose isomerase-like protein (cupin superfamily)
MPYKVILLPKITDPRGNLTFLQYPEQVPFKIERVFWTYDVPSGEIRGGHAYKYQEEIIFALSGSFDLVIVNPNHTRVVIHLNSPNTGVYLPPKTWRHMENFSTNSFALHLSNSEYNESDYLRDFNDFISCQ